jgi:preprotein translocase SecE subunit
MATIESQKDKKALRVRKEPETIRQMASKESEKRTKPTKKTKIKSKLAKPLAAIGRVGSKEYHPIKAPQKKGIRHLNKRVHFIPRFLKNSWAELKQVAWPSKKDALRLTFAVIIFSVVFAIFVQILDFLFSKLVKEIILR